MQHDAKMLPVMLKTLLSRDLEVVVGSRYLEQGGIGDWTESRILSSKIATSDPHRDDVKFRVEQRPHLS